MIKQLSTNNELLTSLPVIQESFKTVADELDLTPVNCPSHPSFITLDGLYALKNSGVFLFGLFIHDVQVGFIAIERSASGVFYIEKLSVLPRHRHNRYGAKLVEFAFDFIRENNGKTVSIGIIDGQAVLKDWYKRFGFSEVSLKQFDHLPFTVCFMEKNL